jgi:hypothetical protein
MEVKRRACNFVSGVCRFRSRDVPARKHLIKRNLAAPRHVRSSPSPTPALRHTPERWTISSRTPSQTPTWKLTASSAIISQNGWGILFDG